MRGSERSEAELKMIERSDEFDRDFVTVKLLLYSLDTSLRCEYDKMVRTTDGQIVRLGRKGLKVKVRRAVKIA